MTTGEHQPNRPEPLAAIAEALGEMNEHLSTIAETLDLIYTYSVKPEVFRASGPFKSDG